MLERRHFVKNCEPIDTLHKANYTKRNSVRFNTEWLIGPLLSKIYRGQNAVQNQTLNLAMMV